VYNTASIMWQLLCILLLPVFVEPIVDCRLGIHTNKSDV
jgi:hypothetical protein